MFARNYWIRRSYVAGGGGCQLALFLLIDPLDLRVLGAKMPSLLLYTLLLFFFCAGLVSAGADYYKILDCMPSK